MLNWFRNWFGPERDGRRFDKDVKWMIDDMEAIYRTEDMQRVAAIATERLATCEEALGPGKRSHAEVLQEMQRLHREARRMANRVDLTAMTFVIIHLRAQQIGQHGEPALKRIAEFLGRWEHTLEG